MIKVIAVLISLIASVLTTFAFNINSIYLGILVGILLFIGCFLVLVILFFTPLIFVEVFIKADEEEKHYNPKYRKMYVIYTRMLLSLFGIKLIIKGSEIIPQHSKFVVVHNHLSNLDPIILNVYLREYPLVFMAKKSISKVPFFGKMLKKAGYIFLERDGSTKDAYKIAKGIKMLRNNECSIGISPEGTRNFTDNVLLPFKDGSFIMAIKARCPIVVCTLKDTQKVKENLFFKKHPVELSFLKVIEYDEFKDLEHSELSKIVFDLMYEDLK